MANELHSAAKSTAIFMGSSLVVYACAGTIACQIVFWLACCSGFAKLGEAIGVCRPPGEKEPAAEAVAALAGAVAGGDRMTLFPYGLPNSF